MQTPVTFPSFPRYQLPALVWAAVIFTLSSLPSTSFPDVEIFGIDKLVHFCIYMLLAVFAYRALRYQSLWPYASRHALLLTVGAVALYGATDEFHQLFVPGRQADIFDLVADAGGAIAYVAFVWLKREPPSRPSAD